MEPALILISVVCLGLTIIVAVLAGSVPFLWWKAFRAEAKVEQLDDVLSELLKTIGLGSQQQHQRDTEMRRNGNF